MDNCTKNTKKMLLFAMIKEAEAEFSSTGRPVLDIEDYVAEKLIEKGVDVPLANIGDKLWTDVSEPCEIEDEACVDAVEVVGIDKTAEGTIIHMKYGTTSCSCNENYLEKNGYFFTEKEAISYFKGLKYVK